MGVVKKGTFLAFSGGEYSDKWTNGPFEVLQDFDQKSVVDAYLSQRVPKDKWDIPQDYEFISWMSLQGYIRDVENSYNWYLGSYAFEPEIYP